MECPFYRVNYLTDRYIKSTLESTLENYIIKIESTLESTLEKCNIKILAKK